MRRYRLFITHDELTHMRNAGKCVAATINHMRHHFREFGDERLVWRVTANNDCTWFEVEAKL